MKFGSVEFLAVVDIQSTDDPIFINVMSDAERDAVVSPQDGMGIYNNTAGVDVVQWRQGGKWKSFIPWPFCANAVYYFGPGGAGNDDENPKCSAGFEFNSSTSTLSVPHVFLTGTSGDSIITPDGVGAADGVLLSLSAGNGGLTSGAGGPVAISSGAGGPGDAGGLITIKGGAAGTSAIGGGILIESGTSSTNSFPSGPITIRSANAGGGFNASGNVAISTGNAVGSNTAGTLSLIGGVGGNTGIGGPIAITGGPGGTLSGAGGPVTISGGIPTAGAIGAIILQPSGGNVNVGGDLTVLTDGNLGFGFNFFTQDSVLGPILQLVDPEFTIVYNGLASLNQLGTSSTVGLLSVNQISGQDNLGNTRVYGSLITNIEDNASTNFTGSMQLNVVHEANPILQPVIGFNINQQKEVFIYNSIRFDNLSTGADPILTANAADQTLTLDGNFNLGTNALQFSDGSTINSASDIFTLFSEDSFSIRTDSTNFFTVQLASARNTTGTFGHLDFVAKDSIGTDTIYGSIDSIIVDPLNGFETGAIRIGVTQNSVKDVTVVGFNELDGLETLIYHDLQIKNQGSGPDPILSSNDNATGRLNLSGDLTISGEGLVIESTATTQNSLEVNSNFITTGYSGQFYSDSPDINIRRILSIVNDNTLAVGAATLYVRQDSTADIVNIFDGTTEVFTIIDGGKSGFGIALPISRVHIRENTATSGPTTGLTIEQVSASGEALLHFKDPFSDFVMGMDTFDDNQFYITPGTSINTSQGLNIDRTTGRVSIGAISGGPNQLNVAGDISSTTAYNITSIEVLSATTLGSGVVNSSLTNVGTLGSLAVTGSVTAGSIQAFGSPNQLQFNNAGVLAGTTGVTFDGSKFKVGTGVPISFGDNSELEIEFSGITGSSSIQNFTGELQFVQNSADDLSFVSLGFNNDILFFTGSPTSSSNVKIKNSSGTDICVFNGAGDVTIPNGDLIVKAAIYNTRKTFIYNPSTTSTLFTQYLGTFSTQGGPVEINLLDSGDSHFSSSFFRVTRHFGVTPIVGLQNMGNDFADYKIFYRVINNTDYELFYQDNSGINATISYIVNINYDSPLVSDTISASNDTGINQSNLALATNSFGHIGIGTTPVSNLAFLLEGDSAIESMRMQTASGITQVQLSALDGGTSFVGTITNDNFAIVTNNTVQVTVDTAGDVILESNMFIPNIQVIVASANVKINPTSGLLSRDSSQRSLKANILDMKDSSWIYKLRPVTFDWIGNGMHDMGFISEEAYDVNKIAATYDVDEEGIETPVSINDRGIIAGLVKEISKHEKTIKDIIEVIKIRGVI